jgi:isopenicillin-N epimerase
MIEFGIPARGLFLLEAGTHFLNHGSFGATPRVVLDAAGRWREWMEANPDHFLREVLPQQLRHEAARLATHVHAHAQDIVFVENATTGINAVLRSLDFQPDDEIVATSQCYGAVRQTIRYVCERTGSRFVEARIPLPVTSEQDILSPVAERLSLRTKLVVLDHIAWPTGLVFPVAHMAALARQRGIKVLVDGAHAPGQLDLDVSALGADWYVGNCHKWLFAPKGCAFLWATGGAKEGLRPLAISHGYGQGFTAEFDWTGTRDFSPWLAVGEALDFVERLGAHRMRTYNHDLVVRAGERIAAAWHSELDGPPELHRSMIGIRLPRHMQAYGPPAAETAKQLQARIFAEHRVVVAIVAVGEALWARISGQIYNIPEDFEALVAATLDAESI